MKTSSLGCSPRKSEMEYETYLEIIKKINESYGTSVEVEHQCIHEFFEGQDPLFKLILSNTSKDEPSILIVSFHLEMPTTQAIQWFLRLRQLDPTLHMTGCYMRDAAGNSHVGEDAEILRMYVIEQEVISAWIQSNKDEEEVLKKPVQNPPKRPSQFLTVQAAMAEFNRMNKKKGDSFH